MTFHERGFFKILVHNFQHELKIPERFVRESWKGLSNPIVLKLPNNAEQRVHWIQRNEDQIWLKQGWAQVAEGFGFEYAQFLTFDYKGRSCFEVKIYHKTSSETLPPHNQRCFFQILVHSKFHQKLMVPKCFSNEYWKKMSNPIKLELPDGVEKKVNWSKRGETIWLEQGWEKVVELCGLCYEWLLTFDYKGRSCFEVKVYDNTALRVAYYNIHENNNNNNKDGEETVTDDDDDDEDDEDFVDGDDYCEVESERSSDYDDDDDDEFDEFDQQYFRRNKTHSGIPDSRFECENHMLGEDAWQYHQNLQGSI
ncbi:hypothetical protein PIB30_078701 [Stylosanthes scabra]|uniref:TF-B3 domain-containing protein n=1 Tax=Stylosanthes scabra TaxID=79078 RepID=A0ABU6VPD5_9FABA|nr:hypothetical protein [Stylosanthes scabra]